MEREEIAEVGKESLGKCDRISSLPDDLRATIISLLPVEETLRSSLLSRAWRNLWTHIIRLNFRFKVAKCCLHQDNMNNHLNRPRHWTLPSRWLVDSIACLNLGIRHLSLSRVGPLKQEQRVILRKRGRHEYDQLQFNHDHVQDDHEFPSSWSLFTKFLEVLELTHCSFVRTAGIPFQRCANLKILKLNRVSIGAPVFDTQLFPNCRLLENISLRSCTLRGPLNLLPSLRPRKRSNDGIFCFAVHMNLKSLELDRVGLKGATALQIKAPGLSNLALHNLHVFYSITKSESDMPAFGLALDTPQLVALQVHGMALDAPFYPGNQSGRIRYYYLASTHILHCFTGPQCPQSTGYDDISKPCSQFQRLRSLSINLDLNTARDIGLLWRILKFCHCLERLYVTIPVQGEKRGISSDQYWCCPQCHGCHLHDEELKCYTFPCLKSIQVRGYTRDVREELQFLTILKQRAPNIEQVEVY